MGVGLWVIGTEKGLLWDKASAKPLAVPGKCTQGVFLFFLGGGRGGAFAPPWNICAPPWKLELKKNYYA